MIGVAREVDGKVRPVDPPAVLREWRNLIHPAVVLKNFVAEPDLEPEARAASALFDACRRDIEADQIARKAKIV